MTNEVMATHNSFFKSQAVQDRLSKIVDGNPDQFATTMLSIISNNDMLSKADSNSILTAALKAVSLKLPIEPSLGFAYVVPYNNKNKRIVEAQFQLGYKGLIQLAQRSGQIVRLNAGPIYEGQLISYDEVSEDLDYIKGYIKKENEKVAGYFGFFRLVNGFEKLVFWTTAQVEEHAKKYSQSYKKGYGNWIDNFDAMARKTVLKSILSTYAPLSTEMQQAFSEDSEDLEYPKTAKDVTPESSNESLISDLLGNQPEENELPKADPETGELLDNKEFEETELDLDYGNINAK